MYDLKARLDEFQVYGTQKLKPSMCISTPKTKLNNPKQQKELIRFNRPSSDRFNAIADEEKQDEFKKGYVHGQNLSFHFKICLIDSDLEVYAYAKTAQTRLPKVNFRIMHLDDGSGFGVLRYKEKKVPSNYKKEKKAN